MVAVARIKDFFNWLPPGFKVNNNCKKFKVCEKNCLMDLARSLSDVSKRSKIDTEYNLCSNCGDTYSKGIIIFS